jgi:hypothetical protein
MTLIREMLTEIETEHKKKLEQIDALEKEKSIIPYTIVNNSTNNKPKETFKAPDTMVDTFSRLNLI